MVKRIILWKLRDDQNKQANLNLMREGLLGLANKVGDIVSVEVGLNYSTADYDIIFIVAFEDPFQLKQFQANPEFLNILQQSQNIAINMIYCDYMVESADASKGITPSTPVQPGLSPMGMMGASASTPMGMPGMNNVLNNSPGMQQNISNVSNVGGGGMFGSIPKNDMGMDAKPYSPMGSKNTPPFAGANMLSNPAPYNHGSSNGATDKAAVNFTTSEDVNQIRFAGSKPMNSNEDSWKCSKCGKTNSSFINMCSCGRKKPVDGQNSMLLNSALLPKVPSMPKPGAPSSGGAWICPTCGKSNNEFMKVCVCGHRKTERNVPGPGGMNPQGGMGFNGPNMNMPKNPAMGMNNIKSPGNNEFFNSFGGPGNGPNNGPGGMGGPNGPGNLTGMGGPGRMNPPMGNKNAMTGPVPNLANLQNSQGGPGGMNRNMNSPGGPGIGAPGGPSGMNRNMNSPGGPGMGGPGGMNRNMPSPGGPGMGAPGGPGGINRNMNSPGGPGMGAPGGMNPNMSRMAFGGPGGMAPNKPGGPGNLPPDSWKCPRCGKVLGNFVGQCVCGTRKPGSRPSGPSNNTHMKFN